MPELLDMFTLSLEGTLSRIRKRRKPCQPALALGLTTSRWHSESGHRTTACPSAWPDQTHLSVADTLLSEWKIIEGVMLAPEARTGPANYCFQEIAGHFEGDNIAS